ncbi:MAG: hypothetical protein AB7E74_08980 [Pirellulales bacterium]|jgi:hypothetical protein
MFALNYTLIGDDSIRPICPHCDVKINGDIPYFQQAPNPGMNMGIETARLFVCPHCQKVLGIGTIV